MPSIVFRKAVFCYQTWPTEEEMAEADRNMEEKRVKKRTLPRGTSDYQVCLWYFILLIFICQTSLQVIYNYVFYTVPVPAISKKFTWTLQAAWIIDTDDEDSDGGSDVEDDMMLDVVDNSFPANDKNNNFDFEDDQGSLNLRDSDEETDVDSSMMVSLEW